MQSTIMKYNSDGIRHCQTGQYKAAMISFNSAVQKLQTLINTTRPPSPDQHFRTTFGWEPFHIPVHLSSGGSSTIDQVYNYLSDIKSIGNSDDDLVLCSVVLMYNLALTSQIYGTEHCKSKILLNSLKFYRIAAGLFTQSWRTGHQQQILPMALTNNLAQLYVDMSDYDNAEVCLEKLRTILSQNDDCIDDDDDEEEAFNSSAIPTFFYENAFVFDTPKIAHAA